MKKISKHDTAVCLVHFLENIYRHGEQLEIDLKHFPANCKNIDSIKQAFKNLKKDKLALYGIISFASKKGINTGGADEYFTCLNMKIEKMEEKLSYIREENNDYSDGNYQLLNNKKEIKKQ